MPAEYMDETEEVLNYYAQNYGRLTDPQCSLAADRTKKALFRKFGKNPRFRMFANWEVVQNSGTFLVPNHTVRFSVKFDDGSIFRYVELYSGSDTVVYGRNAVVFGDRPPIIRVYPPGAPGTRP